MRRLASSTVHSVHDVTIPTYDRTVPPSLVHIGVGAFARAHLATYADDLLASGTPAAIRGCSLRTARAEDQLRDQDGLFTVTTREPDERSRTRVIGSLSSVVTGIDPTVDAIADPATTMVTVTVTEKGYEAAGPDSLVAVLAKGLDRRRQHADAPLVIAALDNLIDNGTVLRDRTLRFAESMPAGLAEWIDAQVSFPCSVVDRMVPATTPADRARLADAIGVVDEAAVFAEAHRSWTIQSAAGLPPLDLVGVEILDDIGPAQRRKLWLLNGPHSSIAYLGMLAGHETIVDAVKDPTVIAFTEGLIDDTIEVMDEPDDDSRAFADKSLVRFANPALGHRCDQVGTDGSVKLRQRILPVMERRWAHGLSSPRHALVVATWLAATTATPLTGSRLAAVDDPERVSLRRTLESSGDAAVVSRFLGEDHAALTGAVVAAFTDVRRGGLDAVRELL